MGRNNICVIREEKNPEVLVVTPLLEGHDISRETKVSIQRNKTKFFWVKSIGDNNIPTNAQKAINWYTDFKKLPPYYLMVDRDIVMGRGMIDKLVAALKKFEWAKDKIGYAYASFEFKGHLNHKFPAKPFDINSLVQGNYISSNSMFRSELLEKVGLVKDDQYKRLLDYAFLLKCFKFGFVGVPVPEASFVAKSTKNDISAGSNEDYKIKYQRVYEDFIKPLLP
jgi:hypothetical protein